MCCWWAWETKHCVVWFPSCWNSRCKYHWTAVRGGCVPWTRTSRDTGGNWSPVCHIGKEEKIFRKWSSERWLTRSLYCSQAEDGGVDQFLWKRAGHQSALSTQLRPRCTRPFGQASNLENLRMAWGIGHNTFCWLLVFAFHSCCRVITLSQARFQQVDSVETSVTVLDDLIPLLPVLAKRRAAGVFNFVNPGTLSYAQIAGALCSFTWNCQVYLRTCAVCLLFLEVQCSLAMSTEHHRAQSCRFRCWQRGYLHAPSGLLRRFADRVWWKSQVGRFRQFNQNKWSLRVNSVLVPR